MGHQLDLQPFRQKLTELLISTADWEELGDGFEAIEKEITDLRRANREAEAEFIKEMTARKKAEADYKFMVERAADQKLDGYRELGARAAAAENARDTSLAACRRLQEDIEVLQCDYGRARAVLDQLVAEGVVCPCRTGPPCRVSCPCGNPLQSNVCVCERCPRFKSKTAQQMDLLRAVGFLEGMCDTLELRAKHEDPVTLPAAQIKDIIESLRRHAKALDAHLAEVTISTPDG